MEESNIDTTNETSVDEQAQAEQSPTSTQNDVPSAAHWYDSLDEDLRGNPVITKYENVDGLARAHADAVRKLSETGFPQLPEHATPEQRSAYNAMRRGSNIATPSDYSYCKGEEADNADLAALKQALFKAGADDYMATEVLSGLQAMQAADEQMFVANAEKAYMGEDNKLREEWGENYQTNLKACQILLSKFPEAQKILHTVGADRTSSVMLMLHTLNAAAADGQIKLEAARSANIDERLAEIQSSDAYKQEWHPDHKSAVDARMDLIFKKVEQMRRH